MNEKRNAPGLVKFLNWIFSLSAARTSEAGQEAKYAGERLYYYRPEPAARREYDAYRGFRDPLGQER